MEPRRTIKVAIVGGGPGCKAVMDIIFAEKLSGLRMKLIGVADINPGAVGYRYAQEKQIYTTNDYQDFYRLKELDLIIELTGLDEVANEISRTKPYHIRLMDHVVARVFWDVFQIEEERIAECKQGKEASRESEEKYRTLVKTSHDMMFTVDLKGNFLFVNKAFERILGYSYEETKKINSFALVHPEDLESVKKRFTGLRQGQRGNNIEYRYRTKSGSYINILNNASPIFDSQGKVVAVHGIARDITSFKQSQELLRESEERFRTIFNTVPDSIFIKDRSGTYQFVNPAMERLFGIPGSELLGKSDEELFGKDTGKHIRGIDARVLQGKMVEHEHTKPVRGDLKTFHIIKVPLRNASGSIVGLCGIARDITERKKAQEALRKAHDELERRVKERTAELAIRNMQLELEIAERKQTEEARRKAEEEKTIILETMSELVVYVDTNMKILWTNRAAADSLGLTVDALVGSYCYKEWFQRSEPCPHCPAQKILETGQPQEGETYSPDGRVWYFRGYPVKNENREIVAIVEVVQEITDRKQTEKDLQEQRNLFKTILAATPDLLALKDRNSVYRAVNPAFCRFIGKKEEEIVGKTDFDLFPPAEAVMYRRDDARVMKSGKPQVQDEEVTGEKGKKWLQVAKTAVYDETGKTAGVLCSVRDISDRKQAEGALRKSEEEKEAVLNSMSDLVVYQDTEHRVVWANKMAGESVGLTHEELVGKYCYKIWNHRSKPCAGCPVKKALETGQPNEAEITSSDGRVWFIRSYPVQDINKNIMGAVEFAREITEHKRIEEEKKKIEAQLQQIQRIESIGTLTGGIAHDFNNLLTVIEGYTSMALMEVDEAASIYKKLKQVLGAASRAAELTRQLLLFSRKQPTKLTSLNINKTINNILKILDRLIGEDIIIVTDFEPNLWIIRADERNIEQVIMNIAVNARDAMPKGGKLIIKTENVALSEHNCGVIPEAKPGKFVRLSIADTGMGIDQSTIQHIFEPFFTTKAPGEGTGLGLAVVYGIVKQHGGFINIHSEPEIGTAFEIYLPFSSVKLKEKTGKPTNLKGFQGNGERILLVEDETGIREFSAEALSKNGYLVFEAAGPQEALELFAQEKGDFHLVFSDVVLPGQSGLELAEQFILYKPELTILLTSGHTNGKAQWSAIRKKGFHFLPKPYNLIDLLGTIRKILKKK